MIDANKVNDGTYIGSCIGENLTVSSMTMTNININDLIPDIFNVIEFILLLVKGVYLFDMQYGIGFFVNMS
ncbi:hypothetical protein DICPUDRAFT_146729 [Dictyostelium purpureum]|uniref:Uncharacterized protein n=1 Tax=Dictyostelium purpureum TaxID=5786 RepID=F0Z6V6_DICPU|nr:uncharacterized protein DICPUDRAFT_146729 [Dictyostelium purpureum]EGC40329.1 hypothetical protein DICPUDRAFT_146729 [Dictyostelium purpureum]|eukprot:XP_003283080.1 hypothetical protein DICPUDRAFT_146729 [Dictyostelium purpureum]